METEFTAILTDDNKLVPNVQDEVLNLITFLKGVSVRKIFIYLSYILLSSCEKIQMEIRK